MGLVMSNGARIGKRAIALKTPLSPEAAHETSLTAAEVELILNVRPESTPEGIRAIQVLKRALRWQLGDVREAIAKHRTAA